MSRRLQGQRIFVFAFLFLIIVLGICSSVLAAGPSSAPNTEPGYLKYQDPARTSGSAMGTMAYVLSLLVLFFAVILFAYLTSRLIAGKMGRMGQGKGSSIHTTLALGPNRNIHLVEMAGRFFVVGATEHSIRLLFEIDSLEQIEKIRDVSTVPNPSFEQTLGSQISALRQIRDRFPAVFAPPIGEKKDDDHEKR